MVRVITPVIITVEADTEDKAQWKLEQILDVLSFEKSSIPGVSLSTGLVDLTSA